MMPTGFVKGGEGAEHVALGRVAQVNLRQGDRETAMLRLAGLIGLLVASVPAPGGGRNVVPGGAMRRRLLPIVERAAELIR